MKLNTNYYGLIYLNRGRYTRRVYEGALYASAAIARNEAKLITPALKKNLKVVRLTLETV